MAESANTTNFKNYFLKNKKLGSIDIDDAIDGSDDVTLIFEKKLTAAQKKSIVEKVNTNLKNNFYGEYKVGTVKTTVNEVINKNTGKFEDEIFNSLKINVTNINFAESNAPTAVQEEGSAFVMTQVIRNNKKFTSPSDILDDKDTNDGLQKIFKSHKNSK